MALDPNTCVVFDEACDLEWLRYNQSPEFENILILLKMDFKVTMRLCWSSTKLWLRLDKSWLHSMDTLKNKHAIHIYTPMHVKGTWHMESMKTL